MTNTQFKSVDEYIQAQPPGSRAALERVRAAIRDAVPAAEETIAYNMPAYNLNGRSFLQFAAWKTHYALYAASEPIVEEFKSELSAYSIEKGTIRFPLSEPVPQSIIARIAKFRAAETG